jgi:2,3-bisphosphoglycerate-dependent phosphoglycerate mutase
MKRLLLIVLFLVGSVSAQTIFIVRHAEKVSETADALSDTGKQRAACLASMLKDANVKALYVSPTARAWQTGAPLAKELKLTTTELPAKDYAALVERIRANPEQNALVVGHSNTVPEIVKALGTSESVSLRDKDYDWMFVVTIDGKAARLTKLHYCATNPN